MPKELELAETVMVLGSGLTDFVDMLENKSYLPYDKIEGWYMAKNKIKGHAGKLLLGSYNKKWYLVQQGRNHYYSGMSMYQCTFPVRVFKAVGIKNIILTNACGGVNEKYVGPNFMVWKDHINMFGDDPLIGIELEDPFVDMTRKYDKAMRELLIDSAKECDITVHCGVYCGRSGPSYETPAEVRAYRSMGADCVGMSTVPECIVAAQVGLRIMAVSLAVSILEEDDDPIDHDWVCKTIGEMVPKFCTFMKVFLDRFEKGEC